MGDLTITRLVDPVVEEHGYPVDSRYVECFWLPVLGPSAVWLLRHAEFHTEMGPYVVDEDVLARSIGIGVAGGRPLRRTLERLVRFHCALGGVDQWAVRTALPALNARMEEHLPEALRVAHREFVLARRQAAPRRAAV
jgi:hypothetical protein